MSDLAGHAGWFNDVHAVLRVTECRAGLPLPHICAERVTFHFNGITHAADAAESVARAEAILTTTLGLTFTLRAALAGDDTPRFIREAFMPSGLAIDIVARAEHTPAPREVAPGLAAVA